MAERNLVLMKSRVVDRPHDCYGCEKFDGNTGTCGMGQSGYVLHGCSLERLHKYIIDEQRECYCIWMVELSGAIFPDV